MKNAFTLIELLIVVLIIGLLAAMAIPRVGRYQDQALIDRANSDISLLNNALEQYKSTYPGTDPNTSINPTSGSPSAADAFAAMLPFMRLDPSIATILQYNAMTAKAYTYTYNTTTRQFEADVVVGVDPGFPNVIPLNGSEVGKKSLDGKPLQTGHADPSAVGSRPMFLEVIQQ